VCAGARNAPLVVPLLKLDSQDGIKIWHHFDERAASFFALGLAKRRLEPVCVVTTSGTAVAELLPAAIESYYSGVPLILLTADRPDRFRGSGAPQAIEQVGIFSGYAARNFNEWNHESPLHLNVSFEEPLFDEGRDDCPQSSAKNSAKASAHLASADGLRGRLGTTVPTQSLDENAVILVGELLENEREPVANFLRSSSLPVWCEAISGLREISGANHIRGGDAALAEMEIGNVLRIGGVPSLRFWRDLETLEAIQVTSTSRTGFPGLARTEGVTNQQSKFDEHTLLDREKRSSEREQAVPQPLPPLLAHARCYVLNSEELAVRELSERIPSEALIFLGNSLPIREWNAVATTEIAHPNVFANRGANGIDGEISTFLGLAQDFSGNECWGIFGDLTTLYDMNAPWIYDQLDAEKRIRIVVINNGGGKIFSKLPGLKDLPDDEKKVTENWHGFDFKKWAELWPRVEVEVIDVRD